MAERDFGREFKAIVEYNFPGSSVDLNPANNSPARLEEEDEKDRRWERVVAASYDGRIAEYFLRGIGTEESLASQLCRDYNLTAEEVVSAIDRGIGQFHELVDFDDEA